VSSFKNVPHDILRYKSCHHGMANLFRSYFSSDIKALATYQVERGIQILVRYLSPALHKWLKMLLLDTGTIDKQSFCLKRTQAAVRTSRTQLDHRGAPSAMGAITFRLTSNAIH
jgi:hypothetical protein